MKDRLYIYGNWAAYDELSDGIELTEDLAMHQMDELLRFRRNGVQFDAYLMDAFWYAPDGGYRKWRTPNWPNGPDRWLEACGEHRLLPGLWFTVNTLCHLQPAAAWQDSVDEKGWGMCLFQGGFLADFLEVMEHWYERGIRIFKLDFADLNAVPSGSSIPSAEARVRNIEALRRGLASFRQSHPDAIFMGFNGLEERECMDRTDRPLIPRCIDPAWLDVFDSIYCGDPRPADLPAWSFWRSVDVYSDHMTRAYEASGIPLDRIDNCGFMAGNTGTCYWRMAAGWREMLLLSLARGGRLHVAYGDLGLFDEEDANWWSSAQQLFQPGAVASLGGIPGRGEVYGWKSPSATILVNPALVEGQFTLDDGNEIRLSPGEVKQIPPLDGLEVCEQAQLVNPLGQISGGKHVQATYELQAEGRYRLLVQQFYENGECARTWPTEEVGPPFTATLEHGSAHINLTPEHPWPIWSGISWATFRLPSIPVATLGIVAVHSRETLEVNLVVSLWQFDS